MKRRLLLLLVAALIAPTIMAGTMDGAVTTTAAQDTFLQNNLIPAANAERCKKFGLSAGCTSGQLVSAGCVAVAFSTLTKATAGSFQSCTIYTQDAAGENAYAADELAQRVQDRFFQELAADIAANCASFKALSAGAQNTVCTDLGRPAGCRICQ